MVSNSGFRIGSGLALLVGLAQTPSALDPELANLRNYHQELLEAPVDGWLQPQLPTQLLLATTSHSLNSQELVARHQSRQRALLQQEQTQWKQDSDSQLLVETGKPRAGLAVLDLFGVQRTPSGLLEPAHGELVAALTATPEAELLRLDNEAITYVSLGLSSRPDFGRHLDESILRMYLNPTRNAIAAIELLKRDFPGVDSLNQSQAFTPAAITHQIWEKAAQEGQGQALTQELHLPQGTRWGQGGDSVALLALARRVERVLRDSHQDEEVLAEFRSLLQDGRIHYFFAAGNEGEFQDLLGHQGFHFSAPYQGAAQGRVSEAVEVGAATLLSGHVVATPYSEHTVVDAQASGDAEVAVDSQDVCTNPYRVSGQNCHRTWGTSYAAPRVAGRFHRDHQPPQGYLDQP